MNGFQFDMHTVIIIINIFTFLLFGFDKARARNKGFRVPEIILILFSLFFGGVGALLGMVVFNHKTSKTAFRVIVPLSFMLNYVFSYDSFSIFKSFLQWMLNLIP
jgi:uncharacterized membrane protein YsdA (DUF1294 family)